jgi:DNA-binding beta-propeller fold protein YncE
LVLLALATIALAVAGVEPPRLPGAPAEPPVPGVRARTAGVLVRANTLAPAFLAVEPSGALVVTDRRRRSVLRFDHSGRPLSEWGPELGSGLTLAEPAGVAVDRDRYYVLDRGTPRIVRLDAEGRPEWAISLEPYGTYGLNGLAVDATGAVYAADTGRNRVLVFAPSGRLVRELGRGAGPGQFTQPMALAFAADGALFVADWENARIQRWDRELAPTNAWPTGFRPSGVAVDPLGRVFAPDAERRRVGVFTPRGGAPLGEIGGPGSPPLDLASPKQLAFGPGGHLLYVLGQDGVARVELEDTAPPPRAAGGGLLDGGTLLAAATLAGLGALALARRRRHLFRTR